MKPKILVLLFSICCGLVYAQDPNYNIKVSSYKEVWTGASFKLRLNNHFRVELNEQIRRNYSLSENRGFSEIGVRYRLNKHFSFKTRFRYIVYASDNNKTRWSADAYYNWRKKGFPLRGQYRMCLQDSKESITGDKFTYLRNRLTAEYNFSKLVDPFIAGELYYRFNQTNEVRKTRFTFGLNWRIGKNIDLATFYRVQQDRNRARKNRENIAGFMLTYELRLKKQDTQPEDNPSIN